MPVAVTIKIVILSIYILFALSLVLCLSIKIIQRDTNFNSGFFRIFCVCTFFMAIGDFCHLLASQLPLTGLFHNFYLSHEKLFCGFFYPFAAFCFRAFVMGQNFLALNRFTAVFFAFEHNEIWTPSRTWIAIIFIYTTAAIVQVPIVILSSEKRYNNDNLTGCLYGYFQEINLDRATNLSQTVLIHFTAITCFILSMLVVIRIRWLVMKKMIPIQLKRDYPLIVYSILLNSEEIIVGLCYFFSSTITFEGGSIINQLYSWSIFAYLVSPAFLLFLTSKIVRICYMEFYLPKKWSSHFGSIQVVSLPTAT